MRDSLDIEALYQDLRKEQKRSRLALLFSLAGILSTVFIAVATSSFLFYVAAAIPAFSLGLSPIIIRQRAVQRRLRELQPLSFYGSEFGRYSLRQLVTDALSMLAIGLVIILLVIGGDLLTPIPPLLILVLVLAVIFLGPSILFYFVHVAPSRRGDYHAVLKRSRRMRALLPIFSKQLWVIEAIALQSLGYMDKSIASYIEIIKWACKSPHIDTLAPALNNVAVSMIWERQFDESLPLIEAAVRMGPGTSYIIDTLAAWYLGQDAHPERVLEMTAFFRQIHRGAEGRLTLPAREAYAYALQGNDELAHERLVEFYAISENKHSTEVIADSFFFAGKAELRVGDMARARRNFEKSISANPTGKPAQLARQALQEMGVTVEA